MKPSVAALIDAAARRPLVAAQGERTLKGVTQAERGRLERLGAVRALLYQLLTATGLRTGEARRLRRCDLDLQAGWLRVPAGSSKSGQEQTVPLRPDLVAALTAFCGRAAATEMVIPAGSFPRVATFYADLQAAGIDRVDAEGHVVDLHSLRGTFVTNLARQASIPPPPGCWPGTQT